MNTNNIQIHTLAPASIYSPSQVHRKLPNNTVITKTLLATFSNSFVHLDNFANWLPYCQPLLEDADLRLAPASSSLPSIDMHCIHYSRARSIHLYKTTQTSLVLESWTLPTFWITKDFVVQKTSHFIIVQGIQHLCEHTHLNLILEESQNVLHFSPEFTRNVTVWWSFDGLMLDVNGSEN